MGKLSLDRKRHHATWRYFQKLGLIPKDATMKDWVLHHIDESMRHNDPERYLLWRPQDVWPLPSRVHSSFHARARLQSGMRMPCWCPPKVEAWSRTAEVVKEYRSGATLLELAERFQCSDEVVRKILKTYDVKRRPRGTRRILLDRADEIVARYLADDHPSTRDLAKEFGCSSHSVIRRILLDRGVVLR